MTRTITNELYIIMSEISVFPVFAETLSTVKHL